MWLDGEKLLNVKFYLIIDRTRNDCDLSPKIKTQKMVIDA